MSLFGQTKRHTPPTPKGRRSPLPMFSGADEKRFHPSPSSTPNSNGLYTVINLPLPIPRIPFLSRATENGIAGSSRYDYHEKPGRRVRYVRVCLPIPPRLYARIVRPQRPLRAILAGILILGVLILLLGFRRRPGGGSGWSPPFSEPDSLVLTQEEVAAIWEWEVLSGHHPSIQQRESVSALSFWGLQTDIISARTSPPSSKPYKPLSPTFPLTSNNQRYRFSAFGTPSAHVPSASRTFGGWRTGKVVRRGVGGRRGGAWLSIKTVIGGSYGYGWDVGEV